MRGEIPELPDVYVPFGKGVIRRAGDDITVVGWGRAMWTAMAAAETLATEGISAEVVDLRTLVPPDLALVKESVGRTGRLIVCAEDRSFAGFVRAIQGAVVDEMPGIPTRALGQKNVPGIAQSLILEEASVLLADDIVVVARELVEVRPKTAARARWDWIPPRYFVA